MKTIYKYTIDPNKDQIMMPTGAEILSVSFQRDSFCMWAMVDTEAPLCSRRFIAFGTGHRIPIEIEDSIKFIGTGFVGDFVFHAFEIVLPARAHLVKCVGKLKKVLEVEG